jgi:hypothetical protein
LDEEADEEVYEDYGPEVYDESSSAQQPVVQEAQCEPVPNDDQEITQELSAQDIERNQLIEAFEQSLLAARDALLQLSADSDENVRAVVAQEYFCPMEALEVLANDEADSVRLGVIQNPNVSLPILETLSHDENPEIAHAAQVAREFYIAPQVFVQHSHAA